MTDETNVGAVGAGGTPTPPVSAEPVADVANLSELVGKAVADAIKPLKAEIGGIYSRQDKDRNAARELMDEFKKQKGKGLDDAEAEVAATSAVNERTEREQEKAWRQAVSEKLGLSSTPAVGNGVSGAVDATRVVEVLKMDGNDPQVLQALRENSDPIALAAKLGEIKASRTAPNPSLAPPMSGSAPQAPSVEASTQEYLTEMSKAAGKGYQYGNALKDKYRKKGVPVDDLLLSF